jgi:hypothetical protein
MLNPALLSALDQALLDVLGCAGSYRDLTAAEQRLVDMVNATYARLGLLRRGGEEGGDTVSHLGDKFRALAELADSGALGALFKRGEDATLRVMLEELSGAGSLKERALREADAANFLRDRSATDAHLGKEQEFDALLNGKRK